MPERQALLLVRTPFQARLAAVVLARESVGCYRLIYVTQQNSQEDQHAYEWLSASAEKAQYLHIPPCRPNVWWHQQLRNQLAPWTRQDQSDLVLMASIDIWPLRALALGEGHREWVTFDDGLANIMHVDIYFEPHPTRRIRLYQNWFEAGPLQAFKNRIARHYTVYANFPNIIDAQRLHHIPPHELWVYTSQGRGLKTYYIGQPLGEAMGAAEIQVLARALHQYPIDCYVHHPRETHVMFDHAPLMEKHGMIAEDAILQDAAGADIHLVGWFSTVLFNMAGIASKRTMLLPRNHVQTPLMEDYARRSGCEVVILD